jgi:protein pelota
METIGIYKVFGYRGKTNKKRKIPFYHYLFIPQLYAKPMHLLKSDFKQGKVKFKVTEQDDLWYLSQIIDPGDFVKGKTTRKIKVGTNDNAKIVKKTLTLTVEAETVTFGETGISLRVNGRIKAAPDDIPLESYHAISIEVGSIVTLQKVNWLTYQKQKLKEATQQKYSYLLCLFDREEALFALTKKRGYDILVKIQGEAQKKQKKVQIKKDFQEEIIKALDVYAGRHTPERIILASPAFYKEDLMKKIGNQELKAMIILATCSSVDEHALDEVITRPEIAEALRDSRVKEEKMIMEQLLSEIHKEGLAAYGFEEVKKAVLVGAASSLLLTDECIQHHRENETFTQLEEIMKSVDKLQGKIHLLSSKHESGKQLNGLGGIAVILRYKI